MPSCPRCGAAVEPGQKVCPACQSYQEEVPPPAPAGSPSLIPLDEIRRKVRRGQFFQDHVRYWARAGGRVGLVVGLVAGIVVGALAAISWRAGLESSLEVIFLTALGFTGAGGVLGSVIAVLYMSLVRPVIAAIFWDIERFERGIRRPPDPTRRASTHYAKGER
jgi:hypothetical protein